jgi:hypothetical protein
MSFKNDVRRKTGAFLTSSQEMFEKIFAQATRELKIRRKPKPTDQKSPTAPVSGTSRTKEEKSKVARKTERTVVPPKPPERIKHAPAAKFNPKAKHKKGGGSRVLTAILLFVLLLVIAGFLANYFGFVDFTAIPDLLGIAPKQVVQAPIPVKGPVKPAQKPVVSSTQPHAKEKVPAPPPAPPATAPKAVSKEEKLVEVETPTTVTPLKAEKEAVQEKTPSPSPIDQPKPPEVAAKKESQPAPVQTQAAAKPATPEPAPSKPSTPLYPYSVYLGSFKAPEAVSKALSDYQEKGLAAYWTRVDLGEKGVWFRFFTGHFRTKEEAEKFIEERNIRGAEAGLTKYANFIGSYKSDKEVEDKKRALVSAGFYPYVIKAPDGMSMLYSGAFDRKEYAEKEQGVLASKGIRSELVER